MTKDERLQQLKDEKKLYKVFDRLFDAGWRNYVNDIRRKNDISNIRLFKILSRITGNDFVADLIKFMKSTKHEHAYLELTKKPKGMLLKDSRYKSIPEFMIDKYSAGSYREGKVYIQFAPDRWVSFVF